MTEGPWESTPAMAAATADRFGDRLAVADGDIRLTYAELLDEARRSAPPSWRRASSPATGSPSGRDA
jgi:non-ribosomal peptide synthetase component E (peptide arylation enzyme)